jgi:hypothetical protein
MCKCKSSLRKYLVYRLCIAVIVLFFIVNIIGCDANNVEEPEPNTGKVIGKISASSDSSSISLSDLSNISVKLMRLKSDGSEETVSTKDVYTDSDGKFVLETDLDGSSNLLVKAEKDNLEWRGIVTSTVKSGIAVYIQPLNLITTTSADLYKIIFISDSSLGYNAIRITIDEEIASMLNGNNEYISKVADILKSVFETDKRAFLMAEFGGTLSQWNQIMNSVADAQCALDRDLYFAESENARDLAFRNYLNSISDAYIEVGSSCVIYNKVNEISVRVLLNGIKSIGSELYFEFVKRSAEIRARILNIAVQHEFQKLEVDPSLINKVIFFGDELENTIKESQSQDEVENAFDSYKEKQILNLIKAMGIEGEIIPQLQDSIAVYKDELKASAETSDEDAIINAYVNFYNNISNLVEQQIHSENSNQSTIVDVLILLNTYF